MFLQEISRYHWLVQNWQIWIYRLLMEQITGSIATMTQKQITVKYKEIGMSVIDSLVERYKNGTMDEVDKARLESYLQKAHRDYYSCLDECVNKLEHLIDEYRTELKLMDVSIILSARSLTSRDVLMACGTPMNTIKSAQELIEQAQEQVTKKKKEEKDVSVQ